MNIFNIQKNPFTRDEVSAPLCTHVQEPFTRRQDKETNSANLVKRNVQFHQLISQTQRISHHTHYFVVRTARK